MISTYMYLWRGLIPLFGVRGLILSSNFHFMRLIDIEFNFTSLQHLFYFTLFIVRFNIILFSYYYFSGGADYYRFIVLLVLFILSITLLIYHKRALILFIGWDGLGVTSYLLVLFYINFKRVRGATTTVLTNRLGDVFLFFFLVSLSLNSNLNVRATLSCVFVLLCAFTKRAQAPFRRWLPIAMSAPTPVSSLVHRSTLVTAGLYLLIKYYFFWRRSSLVSITFFAGVITIFVARLIAISEKDLKKIIALRTLRQLGFIISGLGLTSILLSYFHLITHAFFKRCIFVQVGGIILRNNTSQDGRIYSFRSNLFISSALSIRCLSLCGLPILRGFISKDLLLLGVLSPNIRVYFIIIYLLGVFLTFLYRLRIILFSILNSPINNYKIISSKTYRSSTWRLVFIGVCRGFIIFSNRVLPSVSILFLEKLIPLFYWVLLFILPYAVFLFIENVSGIALQDSLAIRVQKIIKFSFKISDIRHLNILSNVYKESQNLILKSGRFISNSPPLLLVFIIILLIIYFFRC